MLEFRTTMWTRLRCAGQRDESAAQALVASYRPPLLRYFRGRGHEGADAEDLVQEVFVRLFSHDLLNRADRSKGRFRAYLVAIAKNVALNHLERERAKRRGGHLQRVPLESTPEPSAPAVDVQFDACWCRSLIQMALDQLRKDNPRQYEVMRLHLEEELTQKELGVRIGRTAEQVRTDIHRARRRLIEAIKREIARYSSSREEFEEELSMFLGALKPM